MNDKRLDLLRLILALAVVAGGAMVLMHRMRGGPDADGGQAAERGRTPYQLTWVSPDELQVHGRTMGPIPFKLILFPGEATVDQAERAAADSYAVLDRINRHMSAYLPDSDLSRLNEAPAGRAVTLDGELLALLEAAGDYTARTDGAFDPTARRLFQLWAAAGRTDRLPTDEQIAGALAMTGWRHLALDRPSGTAVKAIDTLQVDLGAIAKGYAVDQVIEAMRSAGMEAGLAEVGGEVRVFGPGPRDGAWLLGITDPFASADSGGRLAGTLAVTDRAVATSGNYYRFSVIGGRRYSHIIDPRTGRPADAVPSVTVIAGDCMTADVWATALSVLGPEGLTKIEAMDGVEAMMIIGRQGNAHVLQTPGFAAYLRGEIDLSAQ